MLAVIAVVAVLGMVVLPQLLVRLAIARHSDKRPDLPGTGGEFARHLLDRFDLASVKVEVSDLGDHYDPRERSVRLLAAHHDGRSIAAVAIAAHEVGHAIQHANGDRFLMLRQRLAQIATNSDKAAAIFFIAAPVLGVAARTPLAFAGLLGIGVALLGVRVVFALITLPVEYDASFRKALPTIREGNYLDEADLPAVRSVLRAAAFTYVAAALLTLVNLARWLRLLR